MKSSYLRTYIERGRVRSVLLKKEEERLSSPRKTLARLLPDFARSMESRVDIFDQILRRNEQKNILV